MAPDDKTSGWVLEESDAVTEDKGVTTLVPPSATDREVRIVWHNVLLFTALHIGAVYGVYLLFTRAMWTTLAFSVLCFIISGLGVTVGAHRLWCHKSFKARLPLQVLLIMLNCMALQGHVFWWARDHRMHHKYSETDADPHNATRGLFFSHIGWLLVRKHPEVNAKAHTIPVADLEADPLLQFQKKYYLILATFFCFVLPTYLPSLWGESLWTAYFMAGLRLVSVFHSTFFINSVAHTWGNRPYDKNLKAVDMKYFSVMVLGDGFHNFHHAFPWDYKTGELGDYFLNVSKLFIDVMAKIGMAYDLKSVSRDIVEKRVKRTGDGSHPVWGWDDAAADDKMAAVIDNPDKTE